MIWVRRGRLTRPRRASSAWDVTAPVRRSSSKWMARARSFVTRGSRPIGGGGGGLPGRTRRRPWLLRVTVKVFVTVAIAGSDLFFGIGGLRLAKRANAGCMEVNVDGASDAVVLDALNQ